MEFVLIVIVLFALFAGFYRLGWWTGYQAGRDDRRWNK